MANKFLTRLTRLSPGYEDKEESYAPKQRGLGRRVFEGISKKVKKARKSFSEEWTEPDSSDLSPQNPKDWKEVKAKRARDLSVGRPPTAEDAEEYKENVKKKLKRGTRY